MAPSGGHMLVPKAIKAFKYAIEPPFLLPLQPSLTLRPRLALSKTGSLIRAKVFQNQPTTLQAIPARTASQPLHPLAVLRQSRARQTRHFGTAAHRALTRTFPAALPSPAAAAAARAPVRAAVHAARASPFHAPFASPLRPNLTSGTLRHAAGSARHFSSAPAAPAHVVQHVSAAMRAFWLGGQSARFAGADPSTGAARFRAVGPAEAAAVDRVAGVPRAARGATLVFDVAPAVTALPAGVLAESAALEAETLHGLAGDFARSLGALARVQADLKKLAVLGQLPVRQGEKGTLEVRFAGCDGATVERLCDELEIERGYVKEDEGWAAAGEHGGHENPLGKVERDVEMALLFPWAPSRGASDEVQEMFSIKCPRTVEGVDWQSMMSQATPRAATDHDAAAADDDEEEWVEANPWCSHSDSFEELGESDWGSHGEVRLSPKRSASASCRVADDASAFEGVEGMYRFLAECEPAGFR